MPNYTAPGYHRIKVVAVLTKYLYSDDIPDTFIQLFDIKNGEVQELVFKTEYSDLLDEFARRTFDESGDYVVNGFGVRVKPHLDTDDVDGYLPLTDGGNVSRLAIGIEPGTAYVKGYGYKNLITRWLPTDKGIDYKDITDIQIAANYGNYVIVNEACGVWDINNGSVVDIYDEAEARITNREFSNTSPSGAKIGEARVKYMTYDSGDIGTANAKYKLYLYDVNMTSDFNNAKSLFLNNSSRNSRRLCRHSFGI